MSYKIPLVPLALPPSNYYVLTIASFAQVVPQAQKNARRRVFRTWRRVWRSNPDFPILQKINCSIAITICTHVCVKLPCTNESMTCVSMTRYYMTRQLLDKKWSCAYSDIRRGYEWMCLYGDLAQAQVKVFVAMFRFAIERFIYRNNEKCPL